MGREPVLLTRRKDFRFAIVRLLERYQVEAQVLSITSPPTIQYRQFDPQQFLVLIR